MGVGYPIPKIPANHGDHDTHACNVSTRRSQGPRWIRMDGAQTRKMDRENRALLDSANSAYDTRRVIQTMIHYDSNMDVTNCSSQVAGCERLRPVAIASRSGIARTNCRVHCPTSIDN